MKRIELASYTLLASAFVLGAVLIMQLKHHAMLQTANATMVVNSGAITAMTARTRSNEESLFILENTTQQLLIYQTNLTRKRLELAWRQDLRTLFGSGRSTSTTRTPSRNTR